MLKQIPISQFRALTGQTLLDARPCLITHEGEVIGMFADPEEVLILEGMHPGAKKRLKARWALMRTSQGSTVYSV